MNAFVPFTISNSEQFSKLLLKFACLGIFKTQWVEIEKIYIFLKIKYWKANALGIVYFDFRRSLKCQRSSETIRCYTN